MKISVAFLSLALVGLAALVDAAPIPGGQCESRRCARIDDSDADLVRRFGFFSKSKSRPPSPAMPTRKYWNIHQVYQQQLVPPHQQVYQQQFAPPHQQVYQPIVYYQEQPRPRDPSSRRHGGQSSNRHRDHSEDRGYRDTEASRRHGGQSSNRHRDHSEDRGYRKSRVHSEDRGRRAHDSDHGRTQSHGRPREQSRGRPSQRRPDTPGPRRPDYRGDDQRSKPIGGHTSRPPRSPPPRQWSHPGDLRGVPRMPWEDRPPAGMRKPPSGRDVDDYFKGKFNGGPAYSPRFRVESRSGQRHS